ncbi:MAG: selenobiotic family peptide radical SAM maturase [Deltaproteobacteria bacterium]|nr:selenobiotic family peptide radical SAM maturase [Deltaproteobacteria bacterium]
MLPLERSLQQIFPQTRKYLKPEAWDRFRSRVEGLENPEALFDILDGFPFDPEGPAFLPDLSRLEWAIQQTRTPAADANPEPDDWTVNPGLQLLSLSFRNLTRQLEEPDQRLEPEAGEEMVLVWRDPRSTAVRFRPARDEDLLALKMILEEIRPEEAALAGGVTPGETEAALWRAAAEGILIAPRTRIRRDPASFADTAITDPEFLEASFFTLQWHITQVCDLHCKHCYDRSRRSPLTLDQGTRILEDLQRFCREKRVRGQISFSGGNPLLYPEFNALYRAAAETGFRTAILGNPTSRDRLEAIRAIQEPEFFQVSLEGLARHNDAIRGAGHFDRILEFLPLLKELGIYSMVMLTLTRDNLEEVIPLAELLRDKTDAFFFNRLAQVGEGANLRGPSREEYAAFLEAYLEAAAANPLMGLKDNLTNIVHYRKGIPAFGGCTGYGCGAAFNFLTLLPDGEVHACRKLPSLLGNVLESSLTEIYESEVARRYRGGTEACRGCPIRPVCGGCLAVAYGKGLDIFQERDPYCFL